MRTHFTVALSTLVGIAIGAIAGQGLQAQSKAPVYTVTEVEVTNIERFLKEYVPLAQASDRAARGRVIAVGAKIIALDGVAPSRAAIQRWDSLEKMHAWRNSSEFKKAREVGNKYAKFRSFAIEGLPQ